MLTGWNRLRLRYKELRTFGWTVGGILVALSMVWWWRSPYASSLGREIVGAVGVVFIVSATVYPPALREVRAGWLILAHGMGWVNTRVLLTLFYYLVISPVGLAMRLFGRDPLDRRWSPDQPSYWTKREEQRPSDHFEHHF